MQNKSIKRGNTGDNCQKMVVGSKRLNDNNSTWKLTMRQLGKHSEGKVSKTV